MRVCWFGVYRDHTGYGNAALRYILALDQAGVDVVIRPVKLNDQRSSLPERIVELEGKKYSFSSPCEVVVQHILPHMMDYNGRFLLNIGAYCSETDSIAHSTWADRLNRMDVAWGCSRQMKEAALASGVSIPFDVVPIPCDTSLYERTHPIPPAIQRAKERDFFLFYTVGEAVRRKNLAGLLKAFHTEFAPEEPVRLVLKASKPGLSPAQLSAHLSKYCQEIKRGLKLYGRGDDVAPYSQEIIITDFLSEDELSGLHQGCDCFVQASYGESWAIPAMDAMGMGKTPIVPDWGGFPDYITNESGWLLPTHSEQVFGIDDSLSDLYTGRESWAMVDHRALRKAMRTAYEDRELRNRKAAAGKCRAKDFSLGKIGKLMAGMINAHVENQRRLPRKPRPQSTGLASTP